MLFQEFLMNPQIASHTRFTVSLRAVKAPLTSPLITRTIALKIPEMMDQAILNAVVIAFTTGAITA